MKKSSNLTKFVLLILLIHIYSLKIQKYSLNENLFLENRIQFDSKALQNQFNSTRYTYSNSSNNKNFNVFDHKIIESQNHSASLYLPHHYQTGHNKNYQNYEKSKYSFSSIFRPFCDQKICRFPYGKCRNSQVCDCLDGYVDAQYLNFENMVCGYKQKSKFVATLLETLFPVGFGHFYVENFGFAIQKIIVALFCCCFMIISFAGPEKCYGIIFMFLIIVLYFVDIIRFITGAYNDGYNIPLNL